MKFILRIEVEEILTKWLSNSLIDKEVHNWGELYFMNSDFDYKDWEGEGENEVSVTNEVLRELDQLNMNLRTKEDLPILIKCLRSSPGKSSQAISEMCKSLGNVDLKSRARQLKGNSVYAQFCKFV